MFYYSGGSSSPLKKVLSKQVPLHINYSSNTLIMKNYLSILLATLLFTGLVCNTQAQNSKKDKTEKEINVILDQLHKNFKEKDIDSYSALLSENGLYCGTDSKEFWDKESLINLQKEIFSNPDFNFDYELTKRVFLVSDDGKSALVVEQFISPEMFSKHIPVRFTSHHVKTKNGWIIDFIGWSLVPDNEDLGKLVKALEE